MSTKSTYYLLLGNLKKMASPARALTNARYFKTGKGQYGEGDRFLGVSVPTQRQIANRLAPSINPYQLSSILQSEFHELRAIALFVMIKNYNSVITEKEKKIWIDCYLDHLSFVNNWDLVDISAPKLLGSWLLHRNRKLLYHLARSNNLWENRIAILSTLAFIRFNDVDDLLKLTKIFLKHPHDLIHKATGWMLREAWKRNPMIIEDFLSRYAVKMPRTMLRYAIEKMAKSRQKEFLLLKNN
jgi:3-methyladenine DNA glycosylase AlkD